MSDKDLNKGIGGLLDPSYKTKEDLRKDKLNKFYRDHIENSKPYTPNKAALSIADYMPTPTLMTPEKTVEKPIVKTKGTPFRYEGWGDGIMDRTEPSKKDIEKRIATMGDPKSNGKWAEWVEKNKFEDTEAMKNKKANDWITRRPDNNKKILEAKPKNMPILTYVDKMSVLYGGQEKRRYDDAGRLLKKEKDKGYTREFKSEDPSTYLSNEDQQKNMLLDTINAKQMTQEADRINALQKMDHFMIENSSVKHPDYPKAPPKNVTAQDIKKIYEDKK